MNIFEDSNEIDYYSALNLWGDKSIDVHFRHKASKARKKTTLSGYSLCEDQFIALNPAQVQAAVDKIANQFLMAGLKNGDVLALQLPNSVETQMLYLACWQHGIAIAPLPSLWRETEVQQALIRISPQAFICPIIHDGYDYSDLMYKVGLEISSIKLLFSLGGNPIDGCIALDEFFKHADKAQHDIQLLKANDYPYIDANSPCLISFSKDKAGNNTPYYHTHNQLIAATNIYNSLAKTTAKTNIISPFPPTNMVICAVNIVSWVLSDAELTCLDGLMATEFQNIEIKDALFCLPISFNEENLINALFAQGLFKLVFIQKINSPANSKYNFHNDIIDITTFDEFTFLPLLRQKDEALIEARRYEYKLLDGATTDTIELIKSQNKSDKNTWRFGCSFLPTNIIKTDKKYTSNIACTNNSGKDIKLNIGNMVLDFSDVEKELLNFHGVEDAAILAVEDNLLGLRPVFAIVPKIGAVILHHELVEFLKTKNIPPYKIPQELYKIPEIPRDYDNNIMRLTSKKKLLSLVGPQNSGANADGLVAVQAELALLLASANT